MTLEKLQMIATTLVEFVFKVKWLRWWNLNDMSQESMVSLEDVKEKELEKWLIKATFWAHVVPCPFIYLILHFM